MKISNIEVTGFEAAFRGMRQPLQSHNRADSKYWLPNMYQDEYEEIVGEDIIWDPYHLGENDKKLAKKLIIGGTEHRKFLRMIHVSIDVTAPLFWWKEMDQYRISVTTNSTSTMHKLASTPITVNRFEMDDYEDVEWDDAYATMHMNFVWEATIEILEELRVKYLETKDIRYWKELIRLLPESWLQTRTIDLNYEVLRNIYKQRLHHCLTEWKQFCEMIEKLPYAGLLITDEENN